MMSRNTDFFYSFCYISLPCVGTESVQGRTVTLLRKITERQIDRPLTIELKTLFNCLLYVFFFLNYCDESQLKSRLNRQHSLLIITV